MAARLLVVDFDLTLCATPVPANKGLAAWCRMVECAQQDFAPVWGSRQFVLQRLEHCSAALVLTARPARLRAVTTAWLREHMPELAAAPLSMRADNDHLPATESKAERLAVLRGAAAVEVIDDDGELYRYLQSGDVFHLAPRCFASHARGRAE